MIARVIPAAALAFAGTLAIGIALRWLGARHSGAHVLAESVTLFAVALAARWGRA